MHVDRERSSAVGCGAQYTQWLQADYRNLRQAGRQRRPGRTASGRCKTQHFSSDVIGVREIRIEHDVVGRDIRQIELMSTQATLAVVPLKTCPLRAPIDWPMCAHFSVVVR